MSAYPLSIQMYTVRELTKTPDDFRNVVRQIADIGYAGLEAGPPSDMSAKEFRSFVEDLGMKVSSTWGAPTADTVQETVDIAGDLGVSHIVSCWGPDNFTSLEEIEKTATFFEEAAQLLKPHGLQMLYHNHWWEFEHKVDGVYGWDVLFDRTPTLGGEIDLYWASNFGEVDVPAIVRKYAAKAPLLHVKDGPLVTGEPNTACGKGKMDLPAAIGAADPNMVKWLIVELDDYVGGHANMMEAVRDSYTYLTEAGLARGQKA